MQKSRHLWQYSLFQIPAVLFALSLFLVVIAALLKPVCSNFWLWLFLGLSLIALMWTLVLPLDLFLKAVVKLKMGTAGRIAIAHALFWSIAVLVVLLSMLPTLRQSCVVAQPLPSFPVVSVEITPPPSSSPVVTSSPVPSSPSPSSSPSVEEELVSLDWSRWKANLWNRMFLYQPLPGPLSARADFSFVVYRDRRIEDINISSNDFELETFVRSRIQSLVGTPHLTFIESSRLDRVPYQHYVEICELGSPGCGVPVDPSQFPGKESFTRVAPKPESTP